MVLPADSHVHSEWSWGAPLGSMLQTCARAVELGLPAVAFTEHADFQGWTVAADELDGYDHLRPLVADGVLVPPRMDLDGYLASVAQCRDRFPDLRVISGVELGEAHRHPEAAARWLTAGRFERVLGSLHALPVGAEFFEPPGLYRRRPAAQVLRDYLAEVVRLVEGSELFSVLAHIDYPVRYWPTDAEPYDPTAFEAEFRFALEALAASGRALEVNTRVPLHPEVVRWWRDVGGDAVTFGSDAHDPTVVGRGFGAAAAMVESFGFRPGRHPHDVWWTTNLTR